MLARDVEQSKPFNSVKGKLKPRSKALSQSSSDSMCIAPHETHHPEIEKGAAGDELSEHGLFSCVKCGIWTFACVAIVQPTESAAQYLLSADCSFFKYSVAGSGVSSHGVNVTDGEANPPDPDSFSGSMEKNAPNGLYDVLVQSSDHQIQNMDHSSTMKSATAETIEMNSCYKSKKDLSALGLSAMAYGNSSDSDEDVELPNSPIISDDNLSGDGSSGAKFRHDSVSPTSQQGYDSGVERSPSPSECDDEYFPQRFDVYGDCLPRRANSDDSECEAHDCSAKFAEEDTMTSDLAYSPTGDENDARKIRNAIDSVGTLNFPFFHGCDEDSSFSVLSML